MMPEEPNISIHALAKRATLSRVTFLARILFQSTPSQRGRPLFSGCISSKKIISIHALAKRATIRKNIRLQSTKNFNPRPRKEGDSSLCNSGRSGGYFNPRPRKEGDDSISQMMFLSCLFQSTPSQRGRPLVSLSILYRTFVFQSTPSQRGRPVPL